jgi:hypothetical protein
MLGGIGKKTFCCRKDFNIVLIASIVIISIKKCCTQQDQLSTECSLNQVGDGTTAFDPSPAEARRMISRSYAVQKTMLVR